jgi:hypothetical protein
MGYSVSVIVCSEPTCTASVKNHRWGKTKATGWFFSRTGTENWCPEHLPDWVIEWRAKNNGGSDKKSKDHKDKSNG